MLNMTDRRDMIDIFDGFDTLAELHEIQKLLVERQEEIGRKMAKGLRIGSKVELLREGGTRVDAKGKVMKVNSTRAKVKITESFGRIREGVVYSVPFSMLRAV
jgi:hypothetical protein